MAQPVYGGEELAEYPTHWRGYAELVKIGEGVHSEVYKARCGEAVVAIKVIDLKKSNNGFERSINLARLQSVDAATVVVPHAVFRVKRSIWIVMPYMDGGSLTSITTNYSRCLPTLSLQRVLRALLEALLHLQERGVTHHDVKLTNLLVDANGGIKLSDHGVSYHSYYAAPALSPPPYWWAPETSVDGPCNVWSFGVAAMELAYGYPPLRHLPVFDATKHKEFKDTFKEMVSSCLRVNAAERPTLRELANHRFFDENDYVNGDILGDLLFDGFRPLEELNMDPPELRDGDVHGWEFHMYDFTLKPKFGSSMVEDPHAGSSNCAAFENVLLSLKDEINEIRAHAESVDNGLSFLYSLATGKKFE